MYTSFETMEEVPIAVGTAFAVQFDTLPVLTSDMWGSAARFAKASFRSSGKYATGGRYSSENNGRTLSLSAAIVLAPIALSVSVSHLEGSKKEKESISVYLKPKSRVLLQKFLEERGYSGRDGRAVTIAHNATDQEVFVYKPLFGQRAAFRVKGLIHAEDGSLVATGRVSTMVGELKEPDFEPALPLLPSAQDGKTDENILMDLPTMRSHIRGASEGAFWKGRVPPCTVRGEKHAAVSGASYTPVPKDKQIVVEGYICSSRYATAEGGCNYERGEDEDEIVAEARRAAAEAKEAKKAQKTPEVAQTTGGAVASSGDTKGSEAATGKTETAAEKGAEEKKVAAGVGSAAEEEQSECPVCKYIKAGPCREEFLAWDACVQSADETNLHTKCFSATCDMMNCMKKHEYYDIMTAGTDFSKIEKAEKSSKEATGEPAAH
jgi:hypothetical protein